VRRRVIFHAGTRCRATSQLRSVLFIAFAAAAAHHVGEPLGSDNNNS